MLCCPIQSINPLLISLYLVIFNSIVYSIHKREKNSIYKDEKENIHAHFIINTISYNNGTWYDKTDKQRINAYKSILRESIDYKFRVYLENI